MPCAYRAALVWTKAFRVVRTGFLRPCVVSLPKSGHCVKQFKYDAEVLRFSRESSHSLIMFLLKEEQAARQEAAGHSSNIFARNW